MTEKISESSLENKVKQRESWFATRLILGGMAIFASGSAFFETYNNIKQGEYSFNGASGTALLCILLASSGYFELSRAYNIFTGKSDR